VKGGEGKVKGEGCLFESTERLGFYFLVLVILCGSFAGKARAMTIEEEKKLGKRIFLEMERSVEFVKDPTLQAFLNRMGQSLISDLSKTPFEFKFYLINVLDPNAYALPGGYIFVTTGLITMAENEHEVAGVLSHEISHVTQRHVSQMIERSKRMSIATLRHHCRVLVGRRKGSEAATVARWRWQRPRPSNIHGRMRSMRIRTVSGICSNRDMIRLD
jgi:hypothetical protein